MEGFGDVWNTIQEFCASKSTAADRAKVADAMLTYDITKFQYLNGTPDPSSIAPESYTLDYALMERPGNKDVQLDLFMDYQNNVALYEKLQEYFRSSQVPLLAIWGKNDVFFNPSGAEAYKKAYLVRKSSFSTPVILRQRVTLRKLLTRSSLS